MSAAFLYGLLLGILFVVLPRIAGDRAAWLILWSAFAIQLGTGAVIVWRRTRMPRMTAALALGAAESAVFAWLAARGTFVRDILLAEPISVVALLLVGPLLLFSERLFSRNKWRAWKKLNEQTTLVDMLTFRHLPTLRE